MSTSRARLAPLTGFLRRFKQRLTDGVVTRSAAQLAYYALFALFPLLLMVLSLLSYLPIGDQVDTLLARTREVLPKEAYAVVEDQVSSVVREAQPRLLSIGFVLALWGASRSVDALRVALNRVNAVTDERPLWKRQLLVLGMTVVLAALMVVALALIAAGAHFGPWLAGKLGLGHVFAAAWAPLRLLVSGLAVLIAAELCYGVLPNVKRPLRFASAGGVFATVAWWAATWGLSMYVEHFGNYNVAYGSIGGVMLLLTWLYISGLVFIVGAALDAALERPPAAHRHERSEALAAG